MNTLEYIIRKVSAESGFNDPSLNASQRALLVDVINEAAYEVWTREDPPLSLQECFIRTTANKELALPPFVGELRAIRPGCTDYCTPKWELHDMMPRFVQSDWKNAWYNWRMKGTVPVAIEWLNTAPGSIIYPVADTDLTVTLVGKTALSNRAVDTITMTSATMTWQKTFLQIDRIFKNKVTDYDITIQDADGNDAAILYADGLESRYVLVDIAEFPDATCCSCGDGTFIMQVLYVPRLPRMENDNDSFPADGYEDIIVLTAKRLIAEMRPGEEQRAMLMEGKIRQRINQVAQHKTGTVQRRLTYKPNPLYGRFTGGSNGGCCL